MHQFYFREGCSRCSLWTVAAQWVAGLHLPAGPLKILPMPPALKELKINGSKFCQSEKRSSCHGQVYTELTMKERFYLGMKNIRL